MSEQKPFASLSASLLARKGHAKPAMRPHGFGPGTTEDLGWNDMGTPPVPSVVRQQAELAREIGATPARLPRGAKGKAAFTLRLDPERHLRLRLACAVKHVSAQAIVTAALDQFLTTLPEIDDLAAQLPSPGKPAR